MQYHLAVIGNDESAFELLCRAAESGQRTAAVLPESSQSSWLVGLALKQLISDLLVDRSTRRQDLLQQTGSPRMLRRLIGRAIARQTSELVEMLERLSVDVYLGEPRFVDRHHIVIADGRTCRRVTLSARHFVVGTGTRRTAMHRPLGLVALHRPEVLFESVQLPSSVCLLSGGSFGCGLAALFSLFGVRTRHVTRQDQDSAMLDLARSAGVDIAFYPSDFEMTAGVLSNAHQDVVDCRRIVGFTENLNLSAIDIEPDENGQLWCSSSLETWCSGVFGIGEVVGFSPDTAVRPVVQAERILRRAHLEIPRPHILDLLVKAQRDSQRSGQLEVSRN